MYVAVLDICDFSKLLGFSSLQLILPEKSSSISSSGNSSEVLRWINLSKYYTCWHTCHSRYFIFVFKLNNSPFLHKMFSNFLLIYLKVSVYITWNTVYSICQHVSALTLKLDPVHLSTETYVTLYMKPNSIALQFLLRISSVNILC